MSLESAAETPPSRQEAEGSSPKPSCRPFAEPLRPEDAAAASEVYVEGFLKDPSVAVLVEDEELRRQYLKTLIQLCFDFSLQPKEDFAKKQIPFVAVVKDGLDSRVTGVALANPLPTTFSFLFPYSRVLVKAMGFKNGMKAFWGSIGWFDVIERLKPKAGEFLGLSASDRNDPTKMAGLEMIATHPNHQGKGHGSVLLQFVLAHYDCLGVPLHLTSSNPRNLGFYRRHGFATLGQAEWRGVTETMCARKIPQD